MENLRRRLERFEEVFAQFLKLLLEGFCFGLGLRRD